MPIVLSGFLLVSAALVFSIPSCGSLQPLQSAFSDPSLIAGFGYASNPSSGASRSDTQSGLAAPKTQPKLSESFAMLDSSGAKISSPSHPLTPWGQTPLALRNSKQAGGVGNWRSDLNSALKNWCSWGKSTATLAGVGTIEKALSPREGYTAEPEVKDRSLPVLRLPLLSNPTSAQLALKTGTGSIPHPQKLHRGGEDVHMVCHADGSTLIGVFDGVGGWADVGVDPALYARRLAAIIQQEFRQNPEGPANCERPLQAWLQTAHIELEASKLPGSCTVCLALLKANGELHILNLGDSSLHILRDGATVFETSEQQHYFNCPFQIGMGSGDGPGDADYYIVDDLAPSDLIVAATDGVWDNMYEEEVRELVDEHPETSALARQMAVAASMRAQDPRFKSPFAVEAMRNGLRHTGGKLDDITVVAARVVPGGKQGGVGFCDTEKGEIVEPDMDLMGSPVSSEEGELQQQGEVEVDVEQHFIQGF
eukprot:CAMPEP_0181325888 /NCGR_PEP_ID=MMETSP1101-20121128/21183_1 /TAXON_ID=46948 /ORGANISM="Rhodomonas abbreviata, Strain Caron Lab Isolate" /LENGTH=480 /DNA_ID=CAMNT_0023434261 /DNA_START=358 /DNA_END=1800 /DNA_ORIENTATION=+